MKRIFTNVSILMCIALLLVPCASYSTYYSEKSNYVTASGVIDYLKYNDDRSALYIGFSDLDYKFDDTCFKIVGENLSIVQENGIDEKISVEDKVSFMTAPKYFGDGYVMPIVSISVNEEELLEFDQGVNNLLDWLKTGG